MLPLIIAAGAGVAYLTSRPHTTSTNTPLVTTPSAAQKAIPAAASKPAPKAVRTPPPPPLHPAAVQQELAHLPPKTQNAHVAAYVGAVNSLDKALVTGNQGVISGVEKTANALKKNGAVKAASNLFDKIAHFKIPGVHIKLF